MIEDEGYNTVIPVIVLEHSSVVSLETLINRDATAGKTEALKITLKND